MSDISWPHERSHYRQSQRRGEGTSWMSYDIPGVHDHREFLLVPSLPLRFRMAKTEWCWHSELGILVPGRGRLRQRALRGGVTPMEEVGLLGLCCLCCRHLHRQPL